MKETAVQWWILTGFTVLKSQFGQIIFIKSRRAAPLHHFIPIQVNLALLSVHTGHLTLQEK